MLTGAGMKDRGGEMRADGQMDACDLWTYSHEFLHLLCLHAGTELALFIWGETVDEKISLRLPMHQKERRTCPF
jgi:hypothetical protein